MKLSALQQSPNLLLNALQSAASTMVASSTSITDPLPQSAFSDSGTVGATLGGNITLLAVASTGLYSKGDFFTFEAGVNSNAFVISAIVQPTVLIVQWLGTPPPISTVGTIGMGTGLASGTSYRLNQGQYLVLNALQQSTTKSDFIHVVVRCQAASVLAVQGLGLYVQSTNRYDPQITENTTLAPVSVKLVSAGEYEAEYIYHLTGVSPVVNAQLSDGAVNTTLVFMNNFAASTYVSEVRSFTRPDASLTLAGPYDYSLVPMAPSISGAAGDVNLGVFIIDALEGLVGTFPSPIKGVYWEAATDNLFNQASLVSVFAVSSPVGNCDSLRTVNFADFLPLGPVSAGTHYVRCRVINEVGLTSAWSVAVSFVYTPNTPVATIATTTSLLTGDMQLNLTESNFVRTQVIPFSIKILQAPYEPDGAAVEIASVDDSFQVGETSKTINIAQILAYYELDAGVVLSISQLSGVYFVDGVNIPVYTKQNEVEKIVSSNYVKPQQYVPFADLSSGNPNVSPTAAMTAALPGTVLEDTSSIFRPYWIKAPSNAQWRPLGSGVQMRKDVTGPTYTLISADLGYTLVFDSATPVSIDMSNSFANQFIEGFHFNFRNKQAGAITLIYTHAAIEGSGVTTVNANKVGSAYLELVAGSAAACVWVSVGDLVP